jgi:hypothetical protein
MKTKTVSELRLRGQPCPADLAVLIERCGDLLDALGISIPVEPTWSPWTDKSYLTEHELSNPDIVANIRAIEHVCEMISFVAETDGGECIGYWTGPDDVLISKAALVYYDTEGMFYLCGSSFIDALYVLCSGYDGFEELLSRLRDHGIRTDYSSEHEIPIPVMPQSPDAVHNEKYERFRLDGGF